VTYFGYVRKKLRTFLKYKVIFADAQRERESMEGITEISTRDAAQPTVISPEDLKALLYLTIRGQNGLTGSKEEPQRIDSEKGVDIKA
jgi:hypothetical protein